MSVMAKTFRSILITGASSGIGASAAETFAGPGVTLSLIARNSARLEEVAERCRAKGAEVVCGLVDVRDADALRSFMIERDKARPLDLVYANAGVTTGVQKGQPREASDGVRALLAINVIGVINTVEPAIDLMSTRRSGRIAVTGSVAALRGLGYSPSYCATKAAIHTYAEGWRAALRPFNVGLSLIIPGFVETRMSDSLDSPRPLLVSSERAARIVRSGLEKGRERIIFPFSLYVFTWLTALTPARWFDFFSARIPVGIPEWKE